MAAPKRNKAEKELDQKRISELYLRGLSLREIAKRISSEREYDLSHVQIKKDIDKIVKELRDYSFQNIQDKQLIEVEKLNKVESEAWTGYEETRQARFLEIVLKCIEKRCRIFGIEEVPETYNERQIIVVTLPADDGADNASDEDQ